MHIEIENLSYTYPDGRKALGDISIKIARGEKISIVGPNGAGKSTLLLHLNGLLRGEGKVRIDGAEIGNETLNVIRRKVGIIFQDPNDQLFCPTVREDVAFGPSHFGFDEKGIDEIVGAALDRVSMRHAQNRAAHHLSLGERKRVSIAAVLACTPEILAFDEPSSMLDPKCRRELADFIVKCDKTVIIATHDPAFAIATTTRCILMNEGKIVADGNTNDILQNTGLLLDNGL